MLGKLDIHIHKTYCGMKLQLSRAALASTQKAWSDPYAEKLRQSVMNTYSSIINDSQMVYFRCSISDDFFFKIGFLCIALSVLEVAL